jgi:hypothetical protein
VCTHDEQLVFRCLNACVGKQSKHLSNTHSCQGKLAEMMIDVFSFISSVDASSMEDISKVVIPNSKGEEDDTHVCKCCSEVHGVKDIEECHCIRREQSRCSRCGLIHRGYDISVMIIDNFDTFNCDIDKLQMEDMPIILPDHVQQRFDELRLQKWRKEQNAKTDK